MNACRCGCGEDAGLWPKTYARLGVTKGDPRVWIHGHRGKKNIDAMYAVDHATGCWNWTGNIENGYGRIGQRLAYRVLYVRERGLVPDGKQLDHLCRNRSCVNPAHLEAVTQTENVRRGKVPKLNMAKAAEIRARCAQALVLGTRTRLAREYGVHVSTITDVVSGRWWKDIDERVVS